MENNKRYYVVRYQFEPDIRDKITGVFYGDQHEHEYSEQYIEELMRKDAKDYGQELLAFKVLRVKFFENQFEMGIFMDNSDF